MSMRRSRDPVGACQFRRGRHGVLRALAEDLHHRSPDRVSPCRRSVLDATLTNKTTCRTGSDPGQAAQTCVPRCATFPGALQRRLPGLLFDSVSHFVQTTLSLMVGFRKQAELHQPRLVQAAHSDPQQTNVQPPRRQPFREHLGRGLPDLLRDVRGLSKRLGTGDRVEVLEPDFQLHGSPFQSMSLLSARLAVYRCGGSGRLSRLAAPPRPPFARRLFVHAHSAADLDQQPQRPLHRAGPSRGTRVSGDRARLGLLLPSFRHFPHRSSPRQATRRLDERPLSFLTFVLQPPRPESMPEHVPVLRPKQAKP